MTKMSTEDYKKRLFSTLISLTLQEMEHELREIQKVHFISDYQWPQGKRFRPIIFLLSNYCVRLDRSGEIAVDGRLPRLAAAIELLHEASLIHDDLVDRSNVRRGAPTLQMRSGQGLALLIGDYLIFRGLKLILDGAESYQDIVIARELASTGLDIAQGEADQLVRYLRRLNGEDRMSLQNYLGIIEKKTAVFFAGSAEAGAALAGSSLPLRAVFREFGLNLGLYFQMMDDLMDVIGDSDVAKKTLRSNLAEGTVTLPMIYAYELYPRYSGLQRLAEGHRLSEPQQLHFTAIWQAHE